MRVLCRQFNQFGSNRTFMELKLNSEGVAVNAELF